MVQWGWTGYYCNNLGHSLSQVDRISDMFILDLRIDLHRNQSRKRVGEASIGGFCGPGLLVVTFGHVLLLEF